MARKRPDPADYRFENKSEETLTREPGQIAPYDFAINTLDKCVVYLMDKIAQVTVDKVTNSRLHFGPVEGSIFLRDCENCVVTVCCGQFRCKNCTNLYIFLYSDSDPSIEYSSGLVFGPYNFSYPLQDEHLSQAKLEVDHDLWSQIFDFNKSEEEHWRIMTPDEFKTMSWTKDDIGDPVNPIPRHVAYGGELTGEIKIGSQQHGEQGLSSFGFATSQKDAELFVDSEIKVTQDRDIFADPSEPENPAFIISDDIDFSGPFESQPAGDETPANSESPVVVDSEELERQRLRDNENKERNKRMNYKDDKESTKKDEKRQKAREELNKWYSERNKQILQRRENNSEAEKHLLEKRKTFATSWKKVGSMIEGDDRKDIARMRSVLIAKKHEN